MAINKNQLKEALQATGLRLEQQWVQGPVRLLIAGGVAGLLGGLLRGERTTGDCDVMEATPDEDWQAVESAARHVASEFDLPAEWLNRQSSMYAWTLPLGWEERCEPSGVFGPMEVLRISRRDLIATKIVSAPMRPQDMEDLIDIAPTNDELEFAQLNLDRLEAESLNDERYDDQRTILEALRGGS